MKIRQGDQIRPVAPVWRPRRAGSDPGSATGCPAPRRQALTASRRQPALAPARQAAHLDPPIQSTVPNYRVVPKVPVSPLNRCFSHLRTPVFQYWRLPENLRLNLARPIVVLNPNTNALESSVKPTTVPQLELLIPIGNHTQLHIPTDFSDLWHSWARRYATHSYDFYCRGSRARSCVQPRGSWPASS